MTRTTTKEMHGTLEVTIDKLEDAKNNMTQYLVEIDGAHIGGFNSRSGGLFLPYSARGKSLSRGHGMTFENAKRRVIESAK